MIARRFSSLAVVGMLMSSVLLSFTAAAPAGASTTVTDFATLSTDLSSAPTSGVITVILGGNITTSSPETLNVAANASVVLDLDGYNLDLTDGATTSGMVVLGVGSTLTITDSSSGAGGTLSAQGAGESAGIQTTDATLVIEGFATVMATGGSVSASANYAGGGAGIGGGGSGNGNGFDGGTVTIEGGATVTANGGSASGGSNFGGGGAGIGGGGGGSSGNGGDGGTVTIEGSAAVTVNGGSASGGYNYGGAGAGVGGGGSTDDGSGGNSGTVTIEGSAAVTVNGGSASGGYNYGGAGAGVGGGGGGDSPTSSGGNGGIYAITSSVTTVTTTGGSASGGYNYGSDGADVGGGGTAGPGGQGSGATIITSISTGLSVNPATGSTAGGTAVTITGTNFVAGSTTVTLGGVSATSVDVVSTTQLTAVTPASSAVAAVDVVVNNPFGPATLASGFTYLQPQISLHPPALVSAVPTISGTAQVGSLLTATTPNWSPGTTFTYQWNANSSPIAGAMNSTLSLSASMVGETISVTVTGVDLGYTPALGVSATSVVGALITSGNLMVGQPTITGIAKQGKRLTAHSGTWTSGATFTYQWYAGGHLIPGATKASLVLSRADDGKRVRVLVTGSLAGYTTAAKTSTLTNAIARAAK